jgi:hypothetical protein
MELITTTVIQNNGANNNRLIALISNQCRNIFGFLTGTINAFDLAPALVLFFRRV